MKIVFLTHQYFPRHVGGTEVFTRGLVQKAVSQGHEVHVITCHESATTSRNEVAVRRTSFEGVPVTELHFNLSLMDTVALAEYDNARIAEALRACLSEYQPELAHITHAMKLSVAAIDVCKQLGIPTIVTLSDFWFICPRTNLLTWDGKICAGPKWVNKCLQCTAELHDVSVTISNAMLVLQRNRRLRRSLLKADRIVALTEFQKDVFVRNGYPAHRIEVIEHGVDLGSLPESRAVGDPRPTIGFIGNLVHPKGPHILAAALKRLPSLPIECAIFGPIREYDPYVAALQNAADCDPRFVLRGEFSPENLGSIVASFDVLAVPALWHENGPLVVKAALKLGVPVLASDIGSLCSMIKPGATGWLVKPGCVESWAKAMAKIASQPLMKCKPQPVKSAEESNAEFLSMYEEVRGHAR